MNKITSKADLDKVYEEAKVRLALRLAAGKIDSEKKDILCCGGTGCHASASFRRAASASAPRAPSSR